MPDNLPTSVPAPCDHAPFDSIVPEAIAGELDQSIATHRKSIEAICASNARDFENVLLARESAELELTHWWNPIVHLSRVADTPALREAHSIAEERLLAHRLWVGQNRALYHATAAVCADEGRPASAEARQRLRTLALRDFELDGVALKDDARERYREISIALTSLTTAFSNAVLDSTHAFRLDLRDRRSLVGLGPGDIGRFRAAAASAGNSGYRISLQAPDVQAVLSFARSRSLRHKLYRAHVTRASDLGPNAGQFDNGERIEKIMALRHEAARLLGFDTSAHHSLATKMAPEPDAVATFLLGLVGPARAAALQELEELEQAGRSLGIERLRPWDVAYVSEHLRRERFELDAEEVRHFFPVDQVVSGSMELLSTLFGIRFAARDDVPLWHADASYYDVFDSSGRLIAGVYLDLFARSGKRGGAWMDICRQRFAGTKRTHRSVAFLTCNFAGPQERTPATLRHEDVVTFLHEFGHVLHHILTEVDYPSIGGISGVEWDAVELPSQLMENFAWDYPALTRLSRHVETGKPLPHALFERMRSARTFQASLRLSRQLEMALFDLRLHRDYDPERGARALETLAQVRREVAVIQAPRWNRFPCSFTHIFAGGYAAGYYSYLWAELLSADAFGRFKDAGGICDAVGTAFRKEVLARGASRTAAENFAAFRGREPDPRALLQSYGLAG